MIEFEELLLCLCFFFFGLASGILLAGALHQYYVGGTLNQYYVGEAETIHPPLPGCVWPEQLPLYCYNRSPEVCGLGRWENVSSCVKLTGGCGWVHGGRYNDTHTWVDDCGHVEYCVSPPARPHVEGMSVGMSDCLVSGASRLECLYIERVGVDG